MARSTGPSDTDSDGIDRRGFVGLAVKTAAAVVTLPAASAWLAGCGSGEETAPAAPSRPAPKPAAPAPQETTPKPTAEVPSEPAPVLAGEEQLVTNVAAAAGMVAALQYVNTSTQADQNCLNCLFYKAQEKGLGTCELLTMGLVKEGGWCSSWAAKAAT